MSDVANGCYHRTYGFEDVANDAFHCLVNLDCAYVDCLQIHDYLDWTVMHSCHLKCEIHSYCLNANDFAIDYSLVTYLSCALNYCVTKRWS